MYGFQTFRNPTTVSAGLGVSRAPLFALTSWPSMPIPSADLAVEAPRQHAPPNLRTLISIASAAAALVGFARDVIGHAIAARLGDADWFSTSTVFAQLNTPARLAGVCGTLANLVLGGMAALLVRIDKRFTSGWYFFMGIRMCQFDELRASPLRGNHRHRRLVNHHHELQFAVVLAYLACGCGNIHLSSRASLRSHCIARSRSSTRSCLSGLVAPCACRVSDCEHPTHNRKRSPPGQWRSR